MNYIYDKENKPYFRLYYYNQTGNIHSVFELIQINPQSSFLLTMDCWSDLAEPPYGVIVFSCLKDALKFIKTILRCKKLYAKDKSYITSELRKCIRTAIQGANK